MNKANPLFHGGLAFPMYKDTNATSYYYHFPLKKDSFLTVERKAVKGRRIHTQQVPMVKSLTAGQDNANTG
jgi:hypothetical protein